MTTKRRIAVTGLGVVSPLGCTLEKYWRNLASGVSGVGRISHFDASTFPVQIAAEVRDFDLSEYTDAQAFFMHDSARVALDRRTQFALAATDMAVRDAGLEKIDASVWTDASIYFGAGEGDNEMELLAGLLMPHCTAANGCDEAAMLTTHLQTGSCVEFALHDQLMEATLPASLIAARYGIQGEVTTCLTACAASAQAIGESLRRIQMNECDLAIAGGAHAMTAPFDVLGFAQLSALSATRNDEPTRASRPFDLHRNGFVLGEGAATLILEEWNAAHKRGAKIYAELIGYGTTSDAYRLTDMHPAARGATLAMNAAFEDAGIAPHDIGYINAHGTSTIENDRMETRAIHQMFGESANKVAISSTKSMTGHAVCAAGALEMIATILALREQVAPPTINQETPDAECDLDYVPNTSRAVEMNYALSNSFGFGGQNVALIARRVE
ncbi:MAG: beta-ketoacyl-[acyl-carrier-protein] synthase family protein [Pyrinomonadaceae bacterium]